MPSPRDSNNSLLKYQNLDPHDFFVRHRKAGCIYASLPPLSMLVPTPANHSPQAASPSCQPEATIGRQPLLQAMASHERLPAGQCRLLSFTGRLDVMRAERSLLQSMNPILDTHLLLHYELCISFKYD